MKLHCVSCSCSEGWTIFSHHLIRTLEVFAGVFGALSVWLWWVAWRLLPP